MISLDGDVAFSYFFSPTPRSARACRASIHRLLIAIPHRSITMPSKLTLLPLFALSQVLLAMTLGCRSTTDNQIDLLERELRVQEDYIYELEDYVVTYSEKLRELRCSAPPQMAGYAEPIDAESLLVPELAVPSSKNKKSFRPEEKAPSKPETFEEELSSPPRQKATPQVAPQKEQTPEFSPEDIEVPEELDFEMEDPQSKSEQERALRQVAATQSAPLSAQDPSGNTVLFIPDPADFESESQLVAEEDAQPTDELFADDQVEETAALVDRVAERLEVRELFQGEESSSPSLLTVVEALDARGEPVDLDGEISLMVMTPNEESGVEKPKRLKRWNFTAEETLAAWQSTDLGDGLHLELPLEKMQLPEGPLELWVRLVTSDGRKLLTQLPFQPSQLSSLSDVEPRPLPSGGLALVDDTETEATLPSNPLRMKTEHIPAQEPQRPAKDLKLVENQEPTDQPRWRASMQRTDRTAEGFATSSATTSGWATQAPGRLPYVPARIATRSIPAQPRAAEQPPRRPVWTSGRSELAR